MNIIKTVLMCLTLLSCANRTTSPINSTDTIMSKADFLSATTIKSTDRLSTTMVSQVNAMVAAANLNQDNLIKSLTTRYVNDSIASAKKIKSLQDTVAQYKGLLDTEIFQKINGVITIPALKGNK